LIITVFILVRGNIYLEKEILQVNNKQENDDIDPLNISTNKESPVGNDQNFELSNLNNKSISNVSTIDNNSS